MKRQTNEPQNQRGGEANNRMPQDIFKNSHTELQRSLVPAFLLLYCSITLLQPLYVVFFFFSSPILYKRLRGRSLRGRPPEELALLNGRYLESIKFLQLQNPILLLSYPRLSSRRGLGVVGERERSASYHSGLVQ